MQNMNPPYQPYERLELSGMTPSDNLNNNAMVSAYSPLVSASSAMSDPFKLTFPLKRLDMNVMNKFILPMDVVEEDDRIELEDQRSLLSASGITSLNLER